MTDMGEPASVEPEDTLAVEGDTTGDSQMDAAMEVSFHLRGCHAQADVVNLHYTYRTTGAQNHWIGLRLLHTIAVLSKRWLREL